MKLCRYLVETVNVYLYYELQKSELYEDSLNKDVI